MESCNALLKDKDENNNFHDTVTAAFIYENSWEAEELNKQVSLLLSISPSFPLRMSLFTLHPYRIFSVYAEFYACSCLVLVFTNVPRLLTVMVLGKKSAVMRSLSPPKGKKEQHTHTHTNRHMFTQLNHFAIHLKLTQHDESTICWW